MNPELCGYCNKDNCFNCSTFFNELKINTACPEKCKNYNKRMDNIFNELDSILKKQNDLNNKFNILIQQLNLKGLGIKISL